MTHSRDRERSREPGDAASGDDEPHAANVPGRSGTRQARRVLLCASCASPRCSARYRICLGAVVL
jgi:hypothetical protein